MRAGCLASRLQISVGRSATAKKQMGFVESIRRFGIGTGQSRRASIVGSDGVVADGPSKIVERTQPCDPLLESSDSEVAMKRVAAAPIGAQRVADEATPSASEFAR